MDYWQAKFTRNVERDQRTYAALRDAGWTVVVIWEHELKKKNREEVGRFLYEVVSLDDPEKRERAIEKRAREIANPPESAS